MSQVIARSSAQGVSLGERKFEDRSGWLTMKELYASGCASSKVTVLEGSFRSFKVRSSQIWSC